jgi:hypothetical protein
MLFVVMASMPVSRTRFDTFQGRKMKAEMANIRRSPAIAWLATFSLFVSPCVGLLISGVHVKAQSGGGPSRKLSRDLILLGGGIMLAGGVMPGDGKSDETFNVR